MHAHVASQSSCTGRCCIILRAGIVKTVGPYPSSKSFSVRPLRTRRLVMPRAPAALRRETSSVESLPGQRSGCEAGVIPCTSHVAMQAFGAYRQSTRSAQRGRLSLPLPPGTLSGTLRHSDTGSAGPHNLHLGVSPAADKLMVGNAANIMNLTVGWKLSALSLVSAVWVGPGCTVRAATPTLCPLYRSAARMPATSGNAAGSTPSAGCCHRTPSVLNSTREGIDGSCARTPTAFSNELPRGGGAVGSAMIDLNADWQRVVKRCDIKTG